MIQHELHWLYTMVNALESQNRQYAQRIDGLLQINAATEAELKATKKKLYSASKNAKKALKNMAKFL